MADNKLTITETEWGVSMEIADGTYLNDNSVLTRINQLIMNLKEKAKRKILIDRTKNRTTKSVVGLFEEVELFRKLGGTGFRVALIAPDKFDNENSKFVENAGMNRGIFVKYFRNCDEAMQWLLN